MPAVNSRGRGRRTISEINMVPFIDVMLVLLIIFMVTAPLITPSMIAVPSVGKAKVPKQAQNALFVQIHKDETVDIKQKIKTAAIPSSTSAVAADIVKLEPAVKATGEEAVPVVISADKSIRYETVVKVMGALQEAGVSRVALSVQTGK
ncbi:MAG: biopolymer transporter ExbD [Pseudomonadota bacterium]|nr:biopolymer transporter ExbD [Pseudomonadota bacterium]